VLLHHFNSIPYGASKSALNFVNLSLSAALPEITFLSISPGWVGTDMGGSFGTQAPVTTKDSVQGIRALVQKKTRKNTGEFLDAITSNVVEY